MSRARWRDTERHRRGEEARHFSELRRGVPRMSSALLSKRLRNLVCHGVVDRQEVGNRVVYQLAPAGE
ncbi:MAG: winged helix-turn-helix transcriptional regulator [Acidimicrobiales bacterium]